MRVAFVLCVLSAVASAVASAAPRMLKGPYLQNLTPTSITLMWELDEQVPGKIVVDGPAGERSIDAPADRVVEARIDQLQPATRYHYKVIVGDQTWTGELATAPENGADVPFSFVVFGDTRNGVEQHRRVLERMAQEVPAFVIGTGDMVDEGVREDQWQQFFDVESAMMRDVVYFPSLGNHDRQGRGRTADTYRAYFSVPENGSDTERYYAFTYASARFLVLDSNAYSFALTDQTAWLERELIATRQDPAIRHIFVVMHHPPFSVSLHGGSIDLRERWTPLFEKYQVSAVFSGHDHVYERAEHDGVHYFVSGGGGAPLYPRRPQPNPVDTDAVKKFERVFHYLRVSVTSGRVEVTGVRVDGTVIETTTWPDGSDGSNGPAPAEPQQHAVMQVGARQIATTSAPSSRSLGWLVIAGMLGLLGAAVLVVRSLRS
jgi:predicted phosphodiesterase